MNKYCEQLLFTLYFTLNSFFSFNNNNKNFPKNSGWYDFSSLKLFNLFNTYSIIQSIKK